MTFTNHLKLLLWKHVLQQWRRKRFVFLEFLVPLIMAIVMMALRFTVVPEKVDVKYPSSSVWVYNNNIQPGLTSIAYTPNTTVVNSLMVDISHRYGFPIAVRGFHNSPAMMEYMEKSPQDYAVEFLNIGPDDISLPKHVRVVIRPKTDSYNNNWKTHEVFPTFLQWKPRTGSFNYPGPDYRQRGFLILQRLITEGVIRHHNASAARFLANLNVKMTMMPYPAHVDDDMDALIQDGFPIFLMLSFIFIAVQTTKDIVDEKEKKLKESMKLMGLNSTAYWNSWFLMRLVQIVVIMSLFTVLCGVDVSGNGAPFRSSDPLVFLTFLLCYGVSILAFCFMVAAFVQKAHNGAALSGIIFFICYCPYFYISYAVRFGNLSVDNSHPQCLVFNLAMAYGAYLISLYEGYGEGIQWHNIHQSPTYGGSFCLLDTMWMMLLDSVLYLIVAWYVTNIRPGQFGVPKPWYFPFQCIRRWCMKRQHHSSPIPQAGIQIKKLRKVFGSGDNVKAAIADLTLDVQEDQITVLLGENGAGKTTLLSILAGLLPPTSGSAMVNGHSVRTDINGVHQCLGFCPQHNVLFDYLTVREHMRFFAKLRGVADVESESCRVSSEIGLESKQHTQAQYLSGGEKRKLSLGIALLGNPKVVILDEPSSGMDPAARRQTWDILQRNRQGRTMLLTTHFMDEADLLGDRIAIMAEGVVKCYGTSQELKAQYGIGYRLELKNTPLFDEPVITSIIKRHVCSAVLETAHSSNLSYLLPADQSSRLSDLLDELKLKVKQGPGTSNDITIETMGIGDVFFRAVAECENYKTDYGRLSKDNSMECLTVGRALVLQQLKALFLKKLCHSWRNKIITAVQFLLPLGLVIFGLAVVKSSKETDPPLVLDMSHFPNSRVAIIPGGDRNNTFLKSFENMFVKQLKDSGHKIEFSSSQKYFTKKTKEFGIDQYNKVLIAGARFENTNNFYAYFNGQPYHGQPIALAYMLNSILKHFTTEKHSITFINHPMPSQISVTIQEAWLGKILGVIIAICFLFGMIFLTSSFVYLPIQENRIGAKHLQLMCGVRPSLYWGSNLCYDYINYLVPGFLWLAVFGGFDLSAYTSDGKLGWMFLMLLLYGLATIPLMYTVKGMFQYPATGMVVITIFSVITGITTTVLIRMLEIVDQADTARTLDLLFSVVFPHYNFSKYFLNTYVNHVNRHYCVGQNFTGVCRDFYNGKIGYLHWHAWPCCEELCKKFCFPFVDDFLSWEAPGVGQVFVFTTIHAVVFIAVSIALECRLHQVIVQYIRHRIHISNDPELNGSIKIRKDVEKERKRILSATKSQDALVLKGVSKRYGRFLAVDNLYLGIPGNECFGLLGQNGAGKTTTFKMLTGDIILTSGDIYLGSQDIRRHRRQVYENMGYCPQFDALIEEMTGRETLTMYARLRGIREERIQHLVHDLLHVMMLERHADKLTAHYSGGTKRKLSTAISLVGFPDVVLLDEPSTGLDPGSKRQLWKVLSDVRGFGKTLLMTSHSMEECEALCTRLAVMTNGRLISLGKPDRLKRKHGPGYTLAVKFKITDSDHDRKGEIDSLKDYLETRFSNVRLFQTYHDQAQFIVPNFHDIDVVFAVMEGARVQFSLREYSVHQTTLEEVFLKLTKNQIPQRLEPRSVLSKFKCCKS